MIAAIMQPTYLPWIGYFDLIDQSDVFVFLDTVAFARRSWQQRNRIATPGGPIWLTVPVLRRTDEPIADVAINNDEPWRRKHWTSIEMSYGRAPFWGEYRPALEPLYQREWTRLCELNVTLIRTLCELSGIDANVVRASELGPLEGAKEELLAAICRHLAADTYLSALGSLAYLADSTVFADAGIDLRFQAYEHPEYPQPGAEFTSHLSFLDAILNAGPSSAAVMREGRGPAMTLAEALAHSS